MSGVSLPVTRPSGRALVVGNPTGRAEPLGTLQRMGFGCAEMDDPYAAMAELCRRPIDLDACGGKNRSAADQPGVQGAGE